MPEPLWDLYHKPKGKKRFMRVDPKRSGFSKDQAQAYYDDHWLGVINRVFSGDYEVRKVRK